MKPRSKDPLVAAITTVLLPALKPIGFRRRGSQSLVRIRDGIVQDLGGHFSVFGGRDTFYFHYSVNSLFCLKEFEGGSLGDRLRDQKGDLSFECWPGLTHAEADASLVRILAILKERVLPYLERTATTSGLLEELSRRQLQRGPKNGAWMQKILGRLKSERTICLSHHFEFERGCCAAKLGDFPAAEEYLTRAILLYAEDGRAWCADYAQLCEKLRNALHDGNTPKLLAEWTRESAHHLGLAGFLGKDGAAAEDAFPDHE